MRRWIGRTALVLLPALLVPLPARGESVKSKKDRTDRQLAQQADDLAESTATAARALRELQKVAIELPRAQQRLAAARGALTAAEARYLQARAELVTAEQALVDAHAGVTTAELQLDAARASIAGLLRATYVRGPTGLGVAMLSGSGPADVVDRLVFLDSIVGHERAALASIADARAQLASRRATLGARLAAVRSGTAAAQVAFEQVRASAVEATNARIAVGARIAQRAAALEVARTERTADLAAYRALQAESRRLAALLRGKGSSGKKAPVIRGLLWPTNGPKTSNYGYRTHPIFNERRFHPGIDIGAPSGQAIKAAKAGTVVHAGAMGSYGNIVVIDHGSGFSTAYAHQSKVLVRRGQKLAAGDVIGRVGSTGRSTGPHLHYETRVNGETVDPMRYY